MKKGFTLLETSMKKIAEKELKSYFSDVEIDFTIMKNSPDNVFYWLTNHSGTHIVCENQFNCKIDSTVPALLEIFEHCSSAKLYKIQVAHRKASCMYGTIIQVPLAHTFKQLIRQGQFPRNIGFSWDGNYKEVPIPYTNFDASEIYRLFLQSVSETFKDNYSFRYVF